MGNTTSSRRLALLIPGLRYGGAERVLVDLANRWSTDGHSVHVVTLDDGQDDTYPLDDRVTRVALSALSVSTNQVQAAWSNVSRVSRLRQSLRQIQPDVVLSFTDRMNILALLATRGMTCDTVVAERSHPERNLPSTVWRTLRRWTYRFARSVIVQTRGAGDCLERSVPRTRPLVIPNAVRPRDTVNDVFPRPQRIVAAGRLSPEKGMDTLIRAFAKIGDRLQNWSLVVFGEGPERHRLEETTHQLQVTPRVTLPGWSDSLDDEFAKSALFVMPSSYEGFPNALLEAMASGLAVIASDCDFGPREIIEDGRTGVLVPPRDETALAEAMADVAADEERRHQLGRAAANSVARFHPDSVDSLWDAVVLERGRGRVRHRTGPKRVLFVIGSLGGGGAERQLIGYLNHLDRSRFTPSLYLVAREGPFLDEVPDDVSVSAFSDLQLTNRTYFPGRVHRQQVRHLEQVIRTVDADVVCAVTLHASLIVRPAARKTESAWLAIEMADPRLDFEKSIHRFRRMKRRMLRAAYLEADRAIAVSAGVRDGLHEFYGLPPGRIAVLPNFVDVALIDARRTAEPIELRSDRFHIVTTGRYQWQKGHVHLIDAVKLLRRRGHEDIDVHFLGQGPLETELRAAVRDAELDDHIHFVGFADNPFRYYASAQLFCLPSLYEGLPLALLEAMACEIPVLATRCPSGPEEVLDDGRFGGLVEPGDAAALADAIEDAKSDMTRWRGRVPEARDRVEQLYSLREGIPGLQTLLDAVTLE